MGVAVIRQLKKCIHALEKSWAEARKKLQCAMKEARKLAKFF